MHLPFQYIFNPPSPKKNNITTLPPTPPPPQKKYQRHESRPTYPSRNICNCLIPPKKIIININNISPSPKNIPYKNQLHANTSISNPSQYITVYALPRHLSVPHNSESLCQYFLFVSQTKLNTITPMNYSKTSWWRPHTNTYHIRFLPVNLSLCAVDNRKSHQ